MRVLVIAYDYPPTQSPRALRWRYLTRELALLGHEVHVLVPDLGEAGIELPAGPGRVVLHRSFPGPFGSLVRAGNRRRGGADRAGPVAARRTAARLNWRGALVDAGKRLAGLLLFPDVRAEWNPWARQRLRRLLHDTRPDVVVTSHEPASTLSMGLFARRRGFPWVADLGDPVCAAYTPRRWRKRAWALEARVCALADRVLVTNEATRALLGERHGLDRERCVVLPNGYDDRRIREDHEDAGQVAFDADRLELVYAGRLYGYRDPAPLLRAVAASEGVRLTLVVPDPPPADAAGTITSSVGGRLRVLGPQPHARVMRMLESADVLVNFGDQGQPVRTPAKLFEYFGIERPILHVHSQGADAAAELLRYVGRGWISNNDQRSLATMLDQLVQRKQEGRLTHGLSLEPLPDYAHSVLGARLEHALAGALPAELSGNSRTGQG